MERYLEAEDIANLQVSGFGFPRTFPRNVDTPADIERAALALRNEWRVGMDAIEDLTGLLEDQGIKIGSIEADPDFDACTFHATDDGELPVIVVRAGGPGDRQRFSIAHEVGHLLLEAGADMPQERMANRFAGAFLVPEATARFELGERRSSLDPYELYLLKRRYGLSMQGWVYRAKDLGILSEWHAIQMFKKFRIEGWHRREPGEALPEEHPRRLIRLVRKMYAEGVVSDARVEELLAAPITEFSFGE